MFKLLAECSAETKFDTVTEYTFLEETTKRIVEKLFLEKLTLVESNVYESADTIFKKAIANSYRLTRESIEQMGEFGKAGAAKAALQARKLLYMKPQVLTGKSEDIKALAIKQWNEKLSECLHEQLLNEYGLPNDKAVQTAKEYLGKNTLRTVTDKYTRDSVLELGKAKKRHIIKTVGNMYRVILYTYKDKDYVVIEAPGKKPEVYM